VPRRDTPVPGNAPRVTLVDDRGRVGRRVNLVDAAAALVVLGFIPVMLGAYLLFRTPAPTLVRISPATLPEGPNQRLEINGTNLRPFMRVSFETIPAGSFLLGSTKYALVDVPHLNPGVYDVILYDYMKEVARLPKALTIAPMATDVELEVLGAFKSKPETLTAHLKVGDRFPSAENAVVQVLAIGEPVPGDLRVRVGDGTITVPLSRQDLSATLRVKCYIVRAPDGAIRCTVPLPDQHVVVAPGAMLTLAMPQGPVLFQIASAQAPR
jgi:hypothetical protein